MPTLLDPYPLHDIALANRNVMAPLPRARSGPERIPTDLMRAYYVQRASAGLIVAEATTISPQGNGWVETPGIYSSAMEAGWRRITDAVHAAGGKIFLQLWHMGRASHSDYHEGKLAVAPSAIPMTGEGIHTPQGKKAYETPRALSGEEVVATVEDYRIASRRARGAGFDGVEIHAANGYLIDQFLQSRTNHRTDAYGGSIDARCRFLDEVVEAVAGEWPIHRVGVRLSPNGVYNDMGSPEYREQFLRAAELLDHHSLAYLHLVDGLAFGFHSLGSPMTPSDFREVFRGPLIANCGYTLESAEEAVESGSADLVAFGRPYIANPDLVDRFRHGWPLADVPDAALWWSPAGARGYTDFPTHSAGAA